MHDAAENGAVLDARAGCAAIEPGAAPIDHLAPRRLRRRHPAESGAGAGNQEQRDTRVCSVVVHAAPASMKT
jgi:hypothetical protein